MVKFYFTTRILLNLYYTLILPHLNYGIIAWGCCADYHLNRLLLLQKKALRIICHSHYRAHTDVLFKTHGILKISDLYHYNLGSFMYNLNKHELPNVFYTMFTKMSIFIITLPIIYQEQEHYLGTKFLYRLALNFGTPFQKHYAINLHITVLIEH